MLQNHEDPESRKGKHLKHNETKSKIIIFILSKSGSVSEPEIRKYIETKSSILDQAGINRHLHQLKKEGYVKFIPARKSKYSSKPGLPNKWNITTIKHLKNIHELFDKIQLNEIHLNKFEKSLNIVLKKFGYSIGIDRYIHFIILLFLSDSFFNACLKMDIESIRSIALVSYRRKKDPKNERLIKELINEFNTIYIRGKLNLELSPEKLRRAMEELAQKRKEILEEYIWRLYGVLTEKERKEFTNSGSGKNIIEDRRDEMYYNENLYPINTRAWTISFFEKFKEKIPELSKISIETVLQTQDECQDMCMKTYKMLSLMEDQQREFDAMCLDLAFEHFYAQDQGARVASADEIHYAERTKENLEEYYASLESKDYIGVKGYMGVVNKLISNQEKNLREVLDKNKDVFKDLIKHYGY